MVKPPEAFQGRQSLWAPLLIGWIALGAAGVAYARFKGIPNPAAWPLLAAFLSAYPFYLVPAFPAIRERFAEKRLPAYLLASAVLPYLLSCLGATEFHWSGLARLVALSLAMGFWFLVLPRSVVTDLAFLAIIPAVLLGTYLKLTYPPVYPRLKEVVFLGHIALIQMAVMALLVARRVPDAGYGFLPNRRDWRIGLLHFLYFVPVGGGLGWLLHAVRLGRPAPPWLIAGSFIGFLWTVALSEEFFIWGVLQQWLGDWTASPTVAVLGASLTFALIHISFGGVFPNWRWMLLSGVLGWFCGRARNLAGSIRAGMVTHALVFAAWKAFFA